MYLQSALQNILPKFTFGKKHPDHFLRSVGVVKRLATGGELVESREEGGRAKEQVHVEAGVLGEGGKELLADPHEMLIPASAHFDDRFDAVVTTHEDARNALAELDRDRAVHATLAERLGHDVADSTGDESRHRAFGNDRARLRVHVVVAVLSIAPLHRHDQTFVRGLQHDRPRTLRGDDDVTAVLQEHGRRRRNGRRGAKFGEKRAGRGRNSGHEILRWGSARSLALSEQVNIS